MNMIYKFYKAFAITVVILILMFWRDVARVILFIVNGDVFVYNYYCSKKSDNCITVVEKSRFEINPDTSYFFYGGIKRYIPYFDNENMFIEHISEFCVEFNKNSIRIYR